MQWNRRQLLRAFGGGLLGCSASGWLPALAEDLANDPRRKRHCVLLWMTGGPSQLDTFDMKPGHENGGSFAEKETSVPGLRFSEHLPQLAQMADKLAVIRSMSTKEGDHGRGTYLMRTGQLPMGPIQYPGIGSLLSKELDESSADLPSYVSILPYRVFNQAAFSPGFLGPRYAPLTVAASDQYQQVQAVPAEGFAELSVDDLRPGENAAQSQGRQQLWNVLQEEFLKSHPGSAPAAHDMVYRRAMRLMQSEAASAFNLGEEPDEVRSAYGRGRFGQGCLMARRLIERGVPFVEVSLGTFGGGSLGWDTHRNNFEAVKSLSAELDAGWASLMRELDERGLLEDTTILWMGEFGRTPKINPGGGRDHYPNAWSCVLAGGGIAGGQAYGSTSDDGLEVAENKVDVGDLLATLTSAVGVSPDRQNISEMGRPIRLAEGKVIKELLV